MVEKTVVLIVHQPRKRKMPVPPPGAAEKEPQRCFISFIFNIYFIKPIQFLIFVISTTRRTIWTTTSTSSMRTRTPAPVMSRSTEAKMKEKVESLIFNTKSLKLFTH